jgi:hypothetical protein
MTSKIIDAIDQQGKKHQTIVKSHKAAYDWVDEHG